MREAADKSAGQFKQDQLDDESGLENCTLDVHV